MIAVADIAAVFRATGLEPLGTLHPESGAWKTVALVGMVGRDHWPAFATSPEIADGEANPLDRFSRRIVDTLAKKFGGTALFPFDGPPYFPFQRWARQTGAFFASPLGLLIHSEFGLWTSFRGAVGFAEMLEIPAVMAAKSPCESCAARPCLSACPVSAFDGKAYDVQACAAHLTTLAGSDCRSNACLARRACPIGREHAYAPAQANFYMEAFISSRCG